MNSNVFQLVSQIREDLSNKLTSNSLAKAAYKSSMQLHRDFYSATGYSVNEYIRHLRLSNALCLIKSSSLSLAEAAYSCGYSSQQAMCRDIKKLLNTTATEYKSGDSYYFLSPINESHPFQVEVSKISIPSTLCLKYYSSVMSGIEDLAVNAFLGNNPNYDGRILGRDGLQKGTLLCYELYVQPHEQINTDEFEACKSHEGYETVCAGVRVKNRQEDINNAWDYLYSSWLPLSMFRYSGLNNKEFKAQYFEEYLYKHSRPCRLKLYLPITRKKEYLNAAVETASACFYVSTENGFNREKDASQRIFDYFLKFHPKALKRCTEFYFYEDEDCCTCGIKAEYELSCNEDFQRISYKDQTFAVLYLSGLCDFKRSSHILLNWVKENSLIPTGKPFAVYGISRGVRSADYEGALHH